MLLFAISFHVCGAIWSLKMGHFGGKDVGWGYPRGCIFFHNMRMLIFLAWFRSAQLLADIVLFHGSCHVFGSMCISEWRMSQCVFLICPSSCSIFWKYLGFSVFWILSARFGTGPFGFCERFPCGLFCWSKMIGLFWAI